MVDVGDNGESMLGELSEFEGLKFMLLKVGFKLVGERCLFLLDC